MLIRSYDLDVQLSTHSDEHFEYDATAHLDVDISSALPYLNATISRGIYLPDKPALSWRHDGRNIGFWPRRIAFDHVESREQATAIAQRLVELVNQVWERRDSIEPDHATHRQLQPLEILGLLPRTNCRLCGEATCFNFALKPVAGQATLAGCTPLQDDGAHAANLAQFETLVATKWPAL